MIEAKDENEVSIPQAAPPPPTQGPESQPALDATPISQTPRPASSEPSRDPTPGTAVQTKSQLPDATSNPSTIARSLSPVPPRPEASRSLSSGGNGRLQHELPNRPEVPTPRVGEHRISDRERIPRDNTRDARYADRANLNGPRNTIHDRVLERQVPSLQQRTHERSDRLHNPERERAQAGWGGDRGFPGRPNQETWHSGSSQNREPHHSQRGERIERSQGDWPASQVNANGRAFEPHVQSARDGIMAPPKSIIPQHPDRAALIHSSTERDRPPSEGQHQERRHEVRRHEGHPSTDRVSRPASPNRLDDRRNPRFEPRRDDRPPVESRQQSETTANGRLLRYEDNRFPTGPRTDRSVSGTQGSPQDRFRESPRDAPVSSPATDPYRRDHSTHQNVRQKESQYGRLNAGPEVPSGPRLPNGNSGPPQRGMGRNVSAPHHVNTQQTQAHSNVQNSMAAPERQTPTGPSSRGPPRNVPLLSRPETVQSAPPTPSSESPDTAGVHPDRLRAIQGAASSPPVNAAQVSSSTERPPRESMPPLSVPPIPVQRPNGQILSPGGPIPSPGGPTSASVAPSPTSRGPPTGPSFNHDRSRGDKRMFAGLQNTLHQAGTLNVPERSGQGASIRGRGGRANNPALPSPSASGPSTPAAPAPPPETFSGRSDLFANRPPTHPMQQSVEVEAEYGRGVRRGDREPWKEPLRDAARDGGAGRAVARDEDRNEERRFGHHRSSRDQGRDDGPPPPMQQRDDDRLPRRNEPRDRGRPPMPPPMERDMRRPPRMDEQRRAESDRRDMDTWNGDRRTGMERRDDRDRRDGGGNGRKRGRGGEEGHIDSKRPRRSG